MAVSALKPQSMDRDGGVAFTSSRVNNRDNQIVDRLWTDGIRLRLWKRREPDVSLHVPPDQLIDILKVLAHREQLVI